MRGAEGGEKQGAEGGGSREGCPPPQLGWVWGGAQALLRNFCKIHDNFTHFASFCEDYDSLRLTQLTKLK